MKKLNLTIATSLLATSMAMAQTDATKYITNPSFEVNGLDGWTVSNLGMQSNDQFSQKQGTYYAEKWVAKGSKVGSASAKQVVSNLPFGKYTLTVGAQNVNQNDLTADCSGVYIYANTTANRTYVKKSADYSVDFENTTGKTEIGFVATSTASGNWISVDNFRLTLVEPLSVETVLEEVKKKIDVADNLAKQKMDAKALVPLQTALEEAKKMTSASAYDDVCKAFFALDAAIEKADFAVKIANPTPGTGTAVQVTKTVTYCPTGATEALMRATMVGANVKEKGVCWSTERNPTVLDSRTTDYWSLSGNIYHVTGLKSATVYYLRPYVMNSTYEVAYGDEVKIVTHPKGTCNGTWDEGAPTADANTRCRTAIKETIEYFNEWTGIKGFTLSGHYGASTPTADCSYGGWMRIGPNSGNQAIGTVIHETGHGVGVGTSSRYADSNLHSWKWFGREANKIYSFLENKEANPYTSDFCMVGDGVHAWGSSATYDWFVNGADKDKHIPLQYAGGCILLYGMFIDGLNPTGDYKNGLPGYTYNFDDDKKYYIMCKDASFGLNKGLVGVHVNMVGTYQQVQLRWREALVEEGQLTDNYAWKMEYNAQSGMYSFKNVGTGRYLSHGSTSMSAKDTETAGETEYIQLMPDRTDIKIGEANAVTSHGYWFTWLNNSSPMSMEPAAISGAVGKMNVTAFDFADTATKQQYIILSEDELKELYPSVVTGVNEITVDDEPFSVDDDAAVYNTLGQKIKPSARGIVIIGTKKIMIN